MKETVVEDLCCMMIVQLKKVNKKLRPTQQLLKLTIPREINSSHKSSKWTINWDLIYWKVNTTTEWVSSNQEIRQNCVQKKCKILHCAAVCQWVIFPRISKCIATDTLPYTQKWNLILCPDCIMGITNILACAARLRDKDLKSHYIQMRYGLRSNWCLWQLSARANLRGAQTS